MKKLFCYLLPAAFIFVQASCKKDKGNDGPDEPIITAQGSPTGAMITGEIGPSGGQLQSDDGLLTVTIPAGALSGNITIGIQPITNLAPLGIGTGYRLTPEGTTFSVPVTVSFKYHPDSLTNTAADFLWIASQNGDGSWNGYRESQVDTTAKTVSVQTTHFSDWVTGVFVRMALDPASGPLKVKESTTISIIGWGGYREEPFKPTTLTTLQEASAHKLHAFTIEGWTLNGASAPVGNLNGTLKTIAGDSRSIRYTAPNKVPSANPVEIAVLFSLKLANGQTAHYRLTSRIKIIDKYYARFTAGGVETVFEGDEINLWDGQAAANGNVAMASSTSSGFSIILKHTTGDKMLAIAGGNVHVGANAFSEDLDMGVVVTYSKPSNSTNSFSTYSSQMKQFVRIPRPGGGYDCDEQTPSSGSVNFTEYTPENGSVVSGTFSGTIWNIGADCANTSIPVSGEFALPLFK